MSRKETLQFFLLDLPLLFGAMVLGYGVIWFLWTFPLFSVIFWLAAWWLSANYGIINKIGKKLKIRKYL